MFINKNCFLAVGVGWSLMSSLSCIMDHNTAGVALRDIFLVWFIMGMLVFTAKFVFIKK